MSKLDDPEFDQDWAAGYQKEMEARKARVKERAETEAPNIRKQLLGLGAVNIVVEYNGAGDSGCIEQLTVFDDKAIPFWLENANVPNPSTLKDTIESIFYDLLETRYGGWEINDGSYGSFTWDLLADTLKHTHSERVTSVDNTETEGW